MAVFTVNGQRVETKKNQKLLRFLRDELHLTSVKDGCSEGACGACTVIIDGRTCKACVPDTDLLDGRNIITVEGLTEWEEKVYTYAYGKAGAVQCGFCIPGMVMCTKALLDVNKEPTDEEIKYALRNNYCRCTGYVKIIDAVRIAAKVMQEGTLPEEINNDWHIGSRVARIDVGEKVLGTGKYPDDFYLDGMLYSSMIMQDNQKLGSLLFSSYGFIFTGRPLNPSSNTTFSNFLHSAKEISPILFIEVGNTIS